MWKVVSKNSPHEDEAEELQDPTNKTYLHVNPVFNSLKDEKGARGNPFYSTSSCLGMI